MAAPSAANRYWAAMASLRSSEPVGAAVGSKLQTCSVDLAGSDSMYMSRCLAAWREITSTPNAATAQQVFARDYYRWLQKYLRESLRLRSDASADAAGRVIWALDVWARVNYALYALNFAWGEVYRLDSTGKPAFRPRVLEKLEAAHAQEMRWAETSRKAMVERYQLSSSAKTRSDAAAAKLQPIPFGELSVQWVGESRSQYARKANPLWALLLDTVRPWSSDWHSHWLGSKGDKDKAELGFVAGDPMLSVALMQWRLLSVQDFATDKSTSATTRNLAWPLHMGTRFSCATLLSYLGAAATESTRVEVVYDSGRAYPNLAHGLSLLAAYAGVILDVDFDQEVTDYTARYLTRFRLPFRDDGSQMTVGELRAIGGGAGLDALPPATAEQRNRPAPVPVTYGDYRDYIKGLAVLQPPACAKGDKNCELSVRARRELEKTPLGGLEKQITQAMRTAANLLGIGGAVGGGQAPVYGLPNPFARSFGDDAYRTALTGKTVSALERLPRAIANLALLLPGLFTSSSSAAAAAARDCMTYFVGPNDTPCTVCEGQPRPACADQVPGLAKPASKSTYDLTAVGMCHQQWVAWLAANPEAAKCFPVAGDRVFWQLCSDFSKGLKTPSEALTDWMVYAERRCPALRPRGGLELFGRRLIHAATFGIL
jgi:hypothetical protein